MNHAIFEFSKLGTVPAVSGTDEVAGNPLQLVYLVTSAVRALLKIRIGILESAVKSTIAVVVD